jgi:hypothetical protein
LRFDKLQFVEVLAIGTFDKTHDKLKFAERCKPNVSRLKAKLQTPFLKLVFRK